MARGRGGAGGVWAGPLTSPLPAAEGLKKLFSGATMASSRGMLVTVGQLSCYDQAKQLVLSTGHLSDGIFTHFIASFIAVSGGVPLGGSQGSERQQALASLLEAPRVPQSLGWDGPR